MTYTVTVPCWPRIVNGVDENLQTYRWCIDNGYQFVKYNKVVRSDGSAAWSRQFVKVLTEEQEQMMKKSINDTKVEHIETKDDFLPVLFGACILIFILSYMLAQLWNR